MNIVILLLHIGEIMFGKNKKKIANSNMVFKGKNKKVKIGLALGGEGQGVLLTLEQLKPLKNTG